MTPDPRKTPQELAEEFDIAARRAYDKQDYVFANELAQHAHYLRMKEQHEHNHTGGVCGPAQRKS